MPRDLIGHGPRVIGNDDLVHEWMNDAEHLLECHWHWTVVCSPNMVARTVDPTTCMACVARRKHAR